MTTTIPAPLSPAPSQLAYTVKQAAAALGVGRTTLYALIQTGKLTPVKIRQRTLLRHDELAALIDRIRAAST